MDDFCSLENIINLIDLPDFINPGVLLEYILPEPGPEEVRAEEVLECPGAGTKVYTKEERRVKILRWQEKRNRARFCPEDKRPKIMYESRSVYAKSRKRLGGRFMKKSKLNN